MGSFPDPDSLWYGSEWSGSLGESIVSRASNICSSDNNPAYTVDDFLAFYPQFGPATDSTDWPIPESVLQVYINLASASVPYDRWLAAWALGMALFTAHWATLYIQSTVVAGSNSKKIVGAGLNRGITTNKSVGDVSVGYESLESIKEWGSWNLTVYGQQFASLAAIIGKGGSYVY